MAVLSYAGDALWVIALTIMFSASRTAWGETAGREKLPFQIGRASCRERVSSQV
jgi:hypothetical protein